ncbi:MAG: helix-turn-helix transcriptional regulator [Bacteroidales bacterium]|nr:helix-turn-helix transcriptional regulator [Bacteroidales bacterium]
MQVKNQIGSKIKSIREIKNVSIEELAERINLSVEQLNRIETGDQLPSLAPLIKIARGLGVRLGTFTDDHEHLGPVVTRGDDKRRSISFSNKSGESRQHLDFYSLAQDKAGRHMEPYLVDIFPSDRDNHALSSHEGEEFIYVLDGTVEISYGKDVFRLEKGDSIYYDSIVAHNVHAANHKPATILGVVYAPF